MERERGNEDRKEKKQHDRSTAEEPERDTRGARPEESPQNPEETATEKSEGEYEWKTEASPRATPKEDTSNKSQKVSNPTRGHQREQKEDLPGKDTKRERDQGQRIRGRTLKQTKQKRQIPGRKKIRRKRTPHIKEARRPRRTRRKREQGGRNEQRHRAESGTKQPNRNKERD